MLEGLANINWARYGGSHTKGKEFPNRIHALISDDSNLRKNAQANLREDLCHQGSIYPATPITIPFLIEILATNDYPESNNLLRLIYSIILNCEAPLAHTQYIGSEYILRCFRTFENIAAGYDVFCQFLHHPSPEIRATTVRLLAQIRDKAYITRGLLRRRLVVEKHPIVKASILIELSSLVDVKYSMWGQKRISAYQDCIINYLNPQHHRLVQLAAAVAWQQITSWNSHRWNSNPLLEKVLEIYFQALIIPIDLTQFADFSLEIDDKELRASYNLQALLDPVESARMLHYATYGELIPFTVRHFIFERLSHFDARRLSPRLNDGSLTPIQIHYLGREMIEGAFKRINRYIDDFDEQAYVKWWAFGGWGERNLRTTMALASANFPHADQLSASYLDAIEYNYPSNRTNFGEYFSGKELYPRQKQVLEVIVNCDAFWKIKSNLFSFFYGLPDERDELLKLLEKKEAKDNP